MSKSVSEKRLVEKLRNADERRHLRDLATFGIYCVKLHGCYTLPFFAPSDALAVQSFEAMIHDERLESLVPELYLIGHYCSFDGKIRSIGRRFIPYQLYASRLSGTPEREKKRAKAAVCGTATK